MTNLSILFPDFFNIGNPSSQKLQISCSQDIKSSTALESATSSWMARCEASTKLVVNGLVISWRDRQSSTSSFIIPKIPLQNFTTLPIADDEVDLDLMM